MTRSRCQPKLAFAVVLVGASGCNALLGNGYGADDTAGEVLDGSSRSDALAEGGGGGGDGDGGDGGTNPDGTTIGDGSAVDASLDGPRCPDGGCVPMVLTAAEGPQRIALSMASVAWSSLTKIGRVALDGSGRQERTLSGTIAAGLKRGVAVEPTGAAVYTTMPTATTGAGRCAGDLATCTLQNFIGAPGAASAIALDGVTLHVGIFNSGGAWEVNSAFVPTTYSMTDKVRDLQVASGKTFFRTDTEIRYATQPTPSAPAANLGGQTPLAFVVSGTTLIVATTNNELRACTLTLPASCTPSVLTVTANAVSAVTADATHLYWVESAGGSVHRCARSACGSSKTTLATGQVAPNDIAVDDLSVYWANYGDVAGAGGSIMRLQKGP